MLTPTPELRSLPDVTTTPPGDGQSPCYDAASDTFLWGAADASYTHVQDAPATTWVITHNLGKYPSVTVVDSAGTWVIGDVQYDSANQVTLMFLAPFSGRAHLN